ncbi:MAG TPA: hypothetical protein VN999_17285 [Thermoanaerobaculia bacterium]|nr:hypothetical protein [Thermoanaerobaculia bacterium]
MPAADPADGPVEAAADPRRASQPGSRAGHDPAVGGLQPFEIASWEVASGEYVEQVRRVLRALVSLSGGSRRGIARILASHGLSIDVHRTLRGNLDLKMGNFLDLCRAIGVHPLELLRLVFREPLTPSPIIQNMAALVGRGPAPARADQGSQLDALRQGIEALQGRVDELLRRTPDMGALAPGAPSGRRP